MPETLSTNTITVGSGTGVYFTGQCDSVIVTGNTITGSGSSTAGIAHGSFASASTPTITGNTISGFSAGSGISVSAGDPLIKSNTIQGCKYGVYVTGGSPKIGYQSWSNRNTINGSNTHGVWVQGSGSAPVIRHNVITGNTYGVTKRNTSSPDVGATTSGGGNNLSGNSTYCIWNQTGTAVPADSNYFGSCDGGGNPPTCWSGSIFYVENLCTGPSRALVAVEPVPQRPGLQILGAYPNPTPGTVGIRYDLAMPSQAVIATIHSASGRLVRSVDIGSRPAGAQEVIWDGRDDRGTPAAAGLYFVRIDAGRDLRQAIKIILAR